MKFGRWDLEVLGVSLVLSIALALGYSFFQQAELLQTEGMLRAVSVGFFCWAWSAAVVSLSAISVRPSRSIFWLGMAVMFFTTSFLLALAI